MLVSKSQQEVCNLPNIVSFWQSTIEKEIFIDIIEICRDFEILVKNYLDWLKTDSLKAENYSAIYIVLPSKVMKFRNRVSFTYSQYTLVRDNVVGLWRHMFCYLFFLQWSHQEFRDIIWMPSRIEIHIRLYMCLNPVIATVWPGACYGLW